MPDDTDELLRQETRGAVRVLLLNRPAKLNALNTALTRALHGALLAADADEAVHAVVLAGAGRGFCAGADLAEFRDPAPIPPQELMRQSNLLTRVQMLMQSLSKPVVSAVQGVAVGAGAGLAIGADMMVAATDLRLGYPELPHGIVPAVVMTGLQRQVGRKLAFELISLGRLLDAGEALRHGLANRVVAPEAVMDTAMEIATAWAACSPVAMAATKTLFYRVADLPHDAAMAAGRDVNVMMRGFRDAAARD